MSVVQGQVDLASQASVTIDGTVIPQPPPLVESILGVIGGDPILLGATGYVDTVFTSRLASDTE